MAFLLRNISYSAEGRQIVRSSRMDDDLLRVGRDPDGDIVLNDLAVALHHATLEQVSAAVLGVSAEAGLTVEIDGSVVQFGQVDLSTGGTIRIGPFRMRVAPQEMGSEDVAIDIERADTAAEEEERFDQRRFALAAVMPGKRAIAWTLTVTVLGLFLAWPIWAYYSQERGRPDLAGDFHGDQLWTSGSLSEGHRALEGNCTACHVNAFEPVQDASCTACHTQVADHAPHARLARAAPEFGTLRRVQLAVEQAFGQEPGRCVECHTEHEGPQQMVATPQRFCSDCHADLDARLPDTRLGDAGDFESLHPEFQPMVLIRWDGEQPQMQRVPLNRNPRENSNLKFPHALHLDRGGGAAQMARRLGASYGFGQQLECADCHVTTPDGTRFQPPDMQGDCGMCHSLAFETIDGTVRTLRHGEPRQVVADIRSFYRRGLRVRPTVFAPDRSRPGDANQVRTAVQSARAEAAAPARADDAVRQVFSPGGACYACHVVEAPAGGSLAYDIRPIAFPTRYLLHGWFDHRPHQVVQRPGGRQLEGSAACASCHRAEASNDAAELLLPNLASCRECHGGETTSLPVESTCAMCHDYHMDEGVPARLLRQVVRGHRWTTTVIPVQPQPAPSAR